MITKNELTENDDEVSSDTSSETSKAISKYISQKEEMINFAGEIASLMSQLKITAMEAIVHYSQKKGIEIEVVAKLVNKDLKTVLKEEAASLNFLRYKNGKVIRPKRKSKKRK